MGTISQLSLLEPRVTLHAAPGEYTVVEVIDILGDDTTKTLRVEVR